MSPTATVTAALHSVLRSPWLRPLNDPVAIDDLLRLVRPTWSLGAVRARVVRAEREAPGVRTLTFQPNRWWPGHVAGQHVQVEVEIEGRLRRRTFSLSSAPRPDGLVAITVRQHESGVVSRWWNEAARVGDVVTLSPPVGQFVLPRPLPGRLVFVSAGSGITPVMAMLRDLEARDVSCRVLLVHSSRSREETIFLAELESLARRRPWLDLRLHFTHESGRLGYDDFSRLAAEAGEAVTFACGPHGFLEAARAAWRDAGRESLFRLERFQPPPRGAVDGGGGTVHALRSGRTFAVAAGQTLLEAAEAAGLRPLHGCRMGICHTCKCRKGSGTAVDVRDGRRHAEPDEAIQICVTTAISDVTLDL